ncbi:MAG: cycloisomerase [Acidobacteriota bacterium]
MSRTWFARGETGGCLPEGGPDSRVLHWLAAEVVDDAGMLTMTTLGKSIIFRAAGLFFLLTVAGWGSDSGLRAQTGQAASRPGRRFEEVARFTAAQARQAVAVDGSAVYVVEDRVIAKYDKASGRLLETSQPVKGLIHLDSAVVVDGRLYCAHSNYPGLPMTSSVEVWETKSMAHVASHSFGIMWGSCTWIDRYDEAWWAVFANYSRVFGNSREAYGNTYWTTLVKFDDGWQWQAGWVFPQEVLERAEPMSVTGGSWGPDGLLYCTGHDRPEAYVIRLPEAGSILELVETVPLGNAGQGIAWDRSTPGILYGINRHERQVISFRLLK